MCACAENENLREHLAELTCDINIKEKLIEELELSQRRLQTMKVQYEEKMTALNTKIRETESERDRVLSSLTNMSMLTLVLVDVMFSLFCRLLII